MRRKILIVIVGTFIFLVVFVVAIFLMFPLDSVRHFAEKQLEKVLKQEQTVEIESLSISPLLNVTATTFRMSPRSVTAENELSTGGGTFLDIYYCAPYIEVQPFIIDEIYVQPSIVKSLRGKPSGKFSLKILDGMIDGDLKSSGEIMEVNAAGSDISLNEFALLSNLTKMQIYGNLTFNVSTQLVKSALKTLKISMDSSNTVLCPKRVKLDMQGLPYIDIPFTVFGDIEAQLELKDDLLVIHKLTSSGPDIRLEVTGDVSLKKSSRGQELNIDATILPSQEWLTANNMKVIYQVCEKHDDGSVHLTLGGTTKKMRHDCGTPIPEPIELTESEPAEDTAKPAKEEAKPAKEEAKPAKEEPKPAEEPKRTRPERADRPDPDSVMRPTRNFDSNEIEASRTRPKNRPSMAGRSRSERLDRGEPSGAEPLMRNTDKLDENIDKGMRRRASGRSEFQRRPGVDREE